VKIILATSNAHKVKEIKDIMKDILEFIELVPMKFDIEEDGKTYEENALKKAKFAYEKTETPSIADDSGLAIDALPDLLGIRSARFMEGKTYSKKNAAILEMLKDVPDKKRTARFTCVAVFYDGMPHVFEGIIEGKIAYEARGENGFGYDPIFIPNGYDKTVAEIGEREKNRISHRARAFKKLAVYLKTLVKQRP
jgi:XTP/dITP diphosphohydrolase